jgi:transposase
MELMVEREMSERPRRVRTAEPMRRQGVIRFEMPEDTLPPDHSARLIWQVLGTLDLSAFTAKSKAVDGRAGRDVLSPTMMLTLWLYAISIGIGSAREIARRTQSDEAFRWIVGDKEVGHAALSAFRVGHWTALEKLMTDVLGALLHKGLVSLERVAQDGTRVRASASAPSFRREATLLECREQAALHVKAVLADPDPEATEAEKFARIAAALDYQRRVEAAIATVQALRDEGKEEPRASTTDADARVMKMPGRRLSAWLQHPARDRGLGAWWSANDRGPARHEHRQRHGEHHADARGHQGAHGHAPRRAPRGRQSCEALVHRSGDPRGSRAHHRDSEGRAVRDEARDSGDRGLARADEDGRRKARVSRPRRTLRTV